MFKTYLLVITILCQTDLIAQLNWSNINGPTGGKFQFISVKNSSELIAASVGNSVFLSSDQGNSWIKKNDGLTSFEFTSLLSNSYGTFISTWDNGVFKFNMSGNTWNPINSGLSTMNIQTLAADSSGNIYAGGSNGNLFKLLPGSSNWELIYSSDSISQVSFLHIDRYNNIYLIDNDYYAPIYGGLFRSSDEGVTWTKISPDNLPNGGITITTDFDGNIYYSHSSKLYRSSNFGLSWDSLGTWQGSNICVDVLSIGSEHLFGLISNTWGWSVEDEEGLIYSADQGQSWQEIGLFDFTMYKLAYDSFNNLLYAATEKGIFKSNNLGVEWTDANTTLDPIVIYDLITDSFGTLYVESELGVSRSSNNGINWKNLFNGLPTSGQLAYFDSIIYCLSLSGLYKYSDLTQKWDRLSIFQARDITHDEFGNIYMVGQNSIVKSTDHGINWQTIFSGGFSTIDYLRDSIIISGSQAGGIYRSTNLGNSWTPVIYPYQPSQFYFNEDSITFSRTERSISRSSDLGLTWETLDPPSPYEYYIYDLEFIKKNEIYVTAASTTGTPYILHSMDFGNSWSNLQAPGVVVPLNFSSEDSILYTGYLTSIYSSKINLTSLDPTESPNINKMDLFQNYPNPFNPSTTISYSLPSNSLVQLKIFNILGQEITTLVNEEKTSGNYQVEFDASNLSSDVYFYTLKAGSFVQTRKMILLK